MGHLRYTYEKEFTTLFNYHTGTKSMKSRDTRGPQDVLNPITIPVDVGEERSGVDQKRRGRFFFVGMVRIVETFDPQSSPSRYFKNRRG